MQKKSPGRQNCKNTKNNNLSSERAENNILEKQQTQGKGNVKIVQKKIKCSSDQSIMKKKENTYRTSNRRQSKLTLNRAA